jgi:tRNA 2-thiouridine synthesizing protein A
MTEKEENTMSLKELDVRGEICPYPMMKTVQALKKLSADDLGLAVITDHAPALDTIPTQAARLGYAATIEETGSPEWRITLTRDK